jgi:hypothetical protein
MAIPSDSVSMTPAPMPPPVATPANGKLVEYEEFIESQLRKTRSHVWSVELAGALMLLAAGTLGYFFVAGLVDHWVMPGGLGFWGRLTALFVFLTLVAVFLARQVLPLLLLRINPLYAAYTIERSRPALKNGLLNFLFFRADHAGMSEAVYQAIEEQAATNLAKVHVEAAVDRSKLIQIGYVLVGIILACAAYTLFSPKDLFTSASRVVMPWADLQAPTRTLIAELEPGDSQAFRGQQVTVKARIEGLPTGAKVRLLYSTVDGQTVDRAIEMTLPPDGYKYAAVLPAGDATLQQPLSYRIEAGDAVTRQYMLHVVAAPTIAVESVEYKYPAYTGLLAQTVEQQGDVKAIEGTQVTIHALANEPIQSAYIDFDGDATLDQRMQVDGEKAQATFTAALQPDRTKAAHHSYQLVFKNEAGQQNLQPVQHQIEVTRDLAPEIQFVLPKKDEIDLPLNGAVDLEVVANDPDFALRRIKLSTAGDNRPLKDVMLLDEVRRGQFVRKIRFTPGKLGLKAGDVIVYSAVAEDNKDPLPNRTETPQRRIRLISPTGGQAPRDQMAKDDAADGQQGQPQDKGQGGGDDEHPRSGQGEPEKGPGQRDAQAANKPDENPADEQQPGDEASKDKGSGDKGGKQGAGKKDSGQQGDKQGEAGQDGAAEGSDEQSAGGGEQNAGEKGIGEKGAEPSAANDGSNDSDAIERILKHREEQNKGAGGSSGDQPDQAQQQPDSGKQQQPKPGQQAGKKSAQPDPANKSKSQPPPGDEKANDPSHQPSADRSTDQQDNSQDGQQGESKQPGQQGKKGQQKPGQQQGQPKQQGPQGAGESSEGESGDEGAESQQQQGNQSGKSSGKGGRQAADSQDSAEQAADQPAGDAGKQGRPSDAKSGKEDATNAQPGDDAAQGKSRGDAKTGPKPPGEKSAAGEPQDKQGEQGQPAEGSDQKSAGKKSSDKSESARDPKNSDSKNGDSKNGAAKDQQDQAARGQDAEPGKSGQGDKSRAEPGAKRDQQAPRDQQNSDANGGDGEKDKGNSAAGQRGEGDKGSPSPQKANQPRDKAPRQSSEDQKGQPKDSPQSPSQSHRESDSEGQTDGDQSGGGKKGGGQKANKSGTGGAGQNTPADEGAGRSEEPGQGETSDQAPGKQPSADKTGQSGSKSGAGTKKAPSSGDKPQASGDKPPSAGGEAGQSETQNPQGDTEPGASNQPDGGKPGANQSPDRPWTPTTDAAEKANLEYARKATDLALAHLKDELAKDRPDPELLNRLGWTRNDLEKFVKRWEQLRGPARTGGESDASAKRELDEALRSLGLRPRATSMQGNAGRDDKSQGYKESRRTSPPPEYAEQYKAYTQGTAKGGK